MTPLDLLGPTAFFAGLATLIVRRRGQPAGSPLAAVIAVAGAILGDLTDRPAFTVVAVAAFALGLALPAALIARARHQAAAGHLAAAARWMGWAARARPGAPHLRQWQALWRAAQAWYAGDPAPAEALRAEWVATDQGALLPGLDALLRRWDRLLTSPAVDAQARALCELGQVDAGVEVLGRLLPPRLTWLGIRRLRGAALAPVAFAGRRRATERLTRLLRLSPPVRALWAATAQAAAGDAEGARAALGALEAEPRLPRPVRAAVAARMHALPTPVTLGPGAQAVLQSLEAEITAGAVLARAPLRRAWLTALLLATFAVGFGALLLRQPADDWALTRALYDLGGLARLPGPWTPSWRLLSYGWLHASWAHLAVNGLMVAVAGPTLEAGLGRLGAAWVWGVAVLGGGLAILTFGAVGATTVGASGGAMGWLGALAVLAVAHPQTRGTRTARAAGRLLALLLALQVLFDLVTPYTSSAGHLGGLAAGALAAWAWLRVLRGGRAPM
ncbi:MAG: rhomboid family intramembrane serine protease [Myxococcales bacterium]|nr:rhomboid family intramembrane serine protease [Myxococcales bacterium]